MIEIVSEGASERATFEAYVARYFAYQHLPQGPMRNTSLLFHDLAHELLRVECVDAGQKSLAFEHLLYAKDAAVRSVLPGPEPMSGSGS